MSSLASSRPRTPPRRAYRVDWVVAIGVFAVAAVFLFDRPPPIFLWDESRNIVNALEMDRRGLGIVTTYGGVPDLWNTKPPLLIWLMVASGRVFGMSLWALRLPGMVATLGTVTIVFGFVRRMTRSIATAALAAAFFVGSPALFGEHGARTADYDSLLTLFVTGYIVLLFTAFSQDRPRPSVLIGATACIVGAALTKSVAGLMPGLGVGVYLVLTGRVRRLLDVRYLAAAAAIVAVLLLYLMLRERAGPGYLASSWHNDIAGRFSQSLVGAPKPTTFYLAILWAGYFAATPLLMVGPLLVRDTAGRGRAALIYSLCIVATFLVPATLAVSKLHHYLIVVLPFMAVAAAIAAGTIVQGVRYKPGPRMLALAAVGIVSIVFAVERAALQRWFVHPAYEGARSSGYGMLFERLANRPEPILVVDPGFADHGDTHYAPVLDAHRLLWRAYGRIIRRYDTPATMPLVQPSIVATCDGGVAAWLQRYGTDRAHVPGCVAILR